MPEPAPHRPPDDSVRVALSGTLFGTKYVNRFWLKVTPSGSPGSAELLALSNAVAAAFRTRFLPNLSNGLHQTSQRTIWFKDSTTEVAVDGSDAGTGGDTTAAEAAGICYLINWGIAGSYRGGHPRTYLAGPTTAGLVDVNTLTTTKRNALSTAAGNFLSDVNALTPTGWSSVQLGTIRFFRGNAALSPPVFEPFLSGAASSFIASQRRRVGR